jgi:hypothetical protein
MVNEVKLNQPIEAPEPRLRGTSRPKPTPSELLVITLRVKLVAAKGLPPLRVYARTGYFASPERLRSAAVYATQERLRVKHGLLRNPGPTVNCPGLALLDWQLPYVLDDLN